MKPLTLVNVSKNFGGLKALDSVHLDVEPGERRALIGPNGAGKTTLFHIISGLLRPSSGRILIFDRDVTKTPPHKRATLGLGRTFQLTNLFLHLTVEENLLLSLKSVDNTRHVFLRPLSSYRHLFSQAESLLQQWGLWDRRDVVVRNLSYGEQRQLEVLMALAQNPKILLLDEPTSGLSAGEAITMTSMLKALPQNITLLIIEHDMDVAFELAEQVTVLHLGRVLADGPRDAVKRDPQVQEIYLGAPQP